MATFKELLTKKEPFDVYVVFTDLMGEVRKYKMLIKRPKHSFLKYLMFEGNNYKSMYRIIIYKEFETVDNNKVEKYVLIDKDIDVTKIGTSGMMILGRDYDNDGSPTKYSEKFIFLDVDKALEQAYGINKSEMGFAKQVRGNIEAFDKFEKGIVRKIEWA